MSIAKTTRADGLETRARLKAAALELFAVHGIAGTTVADIVSASGQRNKASLQYHFGTKEELIKELLIDGAKQVDALRQAMLNKQAEQGGPKTVREVMDAFIRPVHQYTIENSHGTTYLRFLSNVQITHRALFRESIGVQWNVGYRSCLDYFRQYLSAIPAAILEQRMTLVSIYTTSVFSTKEAGSDTSTHTSRLWAPAFTVDNIVDTFVAMLECAPSESTLHQVSSPTTAAAARKKKK